MKTSIVLFVSFCFLLSLPVFFVSCSSENSITQPSEKETNVNKSLAKVTSSSIDSTIDTVITIPNSKMQIKISKTTPSDKINQIEKYFSSHNVSTKTQNVIPLTQDCTTYYQYTWVLQDQFKGESGKNLGIECNWVSDGALRNTYGFSMLLVSNNTDIDNAHSAGFHYDSLMLQLSNYGGAMNQIDQSNEGGRSVGYYYVDEPDENGNTWSGGQVDEVADYASPYAPLYFSSFKWPTAFYEQPITYGQRYSSWLGVSSNLYILCDQYHGDFYGQAEDYWGEFHDYYGGTRNPTDWIHLVINNGMGGGHNTWTSENSSSWDDLIHFATGSLGMNKLWLYANGTDDEGLLEGYCQIASFYGWLLEYAKQYVFVWKCQSPNPCTNCNFQEGEGNWYIEDSYYTGPTEWTNY
jgi:hypothetical protein